MPVIRKAACVVLFLLAALAIDFLREEALTRAYPYLPGFLIGSVTGLQAGVVSDMARSSGLVEIHTPYPFPNPYPHQGAYPLFFPRISKPPYL